MQGLDFGQGCARLAKYLLEGSTVGFAAYCIPSKRPTVEEVLLIAVVAAATFSIVDLFTSWSDQYAARSGLPAYGNDMRQTMRQGAGFSVGTQLVPGGLRAFPK